MKGSLFNPRAVRVIEDLFLLGAALLLIAWAFGDRSPRWHVALGIAIAVAAAVFVRRLAGWIRAKREPDDHS